MTRLDYFETLKALFPDRQIKDNGLFSELDNLSISFNGWTAKIAGKIPYDLAMSIYENYPCKELRIKVWTLGDADCPLEFFEDDIYVKESAYISGESSDERVRRLKMARERLRCRANKNKYLSAYRIDTKEGLVTVLCEYLDYKARLEKKNLNMVASINEIIAKINVRIVDKIDPKMSPNLWMSQSIFSQEYNSGWDKVNRNMSLMEFHRALSEFDRTINPFIEKDMSIDEKVRLLGEANTFSAYPYNYDATSIDDYAYYEIILENREINSKVKFGFTPYGFKYLFSGMLGEKDFVLIRHTFNGETTNDEDCGEIVYLEYFGDNCPNPRSMSFNLTEGTYRLNKKSKCWIDAGALSVLYRELTKITRMVATITIDNFQKDKTIRLEGE